MIRIAELCARRFGSKARSMVTPAKPLMESLETRKFFSAAPGAELVCSSSVAADAPGQFETTADTQPPTATLTQPPHLENGQYLFEITYTDNVGIDNDSIIGTQAVRVIGPNGYNQPAQLQNIVTTPEGTKLARYAIPAPNKKGEYQVVITENGVRDTSGNTVQPGTLATIQVKPKKHLH